jgi:hypothetical protein
MSLARESKFNEQFSNSRSPEETTGSNSTLLSQSSQLINAAVVAAQEAAEAASTTVNKVKAKGLARMESSPALGLTLSPEISIGTGNLVGGFFSGLAKSQEHIPVSEAVEANEDAFKDTEQAGEEGKKAAFFSFSWKD